MTRRRPLGWIAAALLAPAMASTGDGGGPARIALASGLHAGPGSAALVGSLAADTPVEVLGEQDGWLRVRLEGWVPAAAVSRTETRTTASVSPATSAPLASSTSPVAAPSAGSMLLAEGVISIEGKRQRATGDGVEVWLVPEALARGWLDVADVNRARIAELEARAEELRSEAVKAMHLPSLHEATAKRDELLAQRTQVLEERRGILATAHARHEAEARESALGSTLAGDGGRYALRAPKPGAAAAIYARLGAAGQEIEWIVPLPAESLPARIDLDETTARGYLPDKPR